MNKHAGITDKIVGSKTWKAMARKSEDIWVGSKKTIKRNNKRLNKKIETIRTESDATLKSTKKKYKRKLKDAKHNGSRLAAGTGAVGFGAGAVGATEYQNRKTPELGKTASFGHASIDKEAGMIKNITTALRTGMKNSKILKEKKLLRANRDANKAEMAATHATQKGSSTYKGLEKGLKKRQAKEVETARQEYRTSAGYGRPAAAQKQKIDNATRASLRSQKAGELRKIRRTRDVASQKLIKRQTKEIGGMSGKAPQDVAALKTKHQKQWDAGRSTYRSNLGIQKPAAGPLPRRSIDQAWNKVKAPVPHVNIAPQGNAGAVDLGPMRVTKPVAPRRGGVDMGKMGPVKPATIAPANNAIPGTGLKMPAMNMTNLRKGAVGTGLGVGALGVNDLFNGGGLGGSSRGARVVNQY